MQGLLHWLLAGPLRSGMAAAALALSRLFDIFGAALIALVALRKGPAAGLQAVFVALPVVVAAGFFSGTGMTLPLAVLGLWAPVLVLSEALRRSASLALMMQAGAALFGVLLAAWFLLDSQPMATVQAFLEGQVLPLFERVEGRALDLTDAQRTALAMVTPGLVAAGSLLMTIVAVLVGRWWQAMAFNPGGFRRDFHRLRHGRSAALAVAVLVLVAAMTGQPVPIGLALAGTVMLIFQGLALVHGVLAAAGQPAIWLWGVYGLVVLLPLPATVLLTIAGGIDNWMDFRRLAGQAAANSNE